jgi:putative (di)nucleoside polyphosphate hydrolase
VINRDELYLKLPYRPGVGLMLVNDDKKVFVGKRIDTKSDAWQMPQGGIDEGEHPDVTAMRELKEEIGTNNVKIITVAKLWFYYDLPNHLINQIWDGKYRGQKQRWYLCRFLGEDSEINIQTFHPEFSDWRWIDINELTKVIVPFKRKLYGEIITEFKDYIENIEKY